MNNDLHLPGRRPFASHWRCLNEFGSAFRVLGFGLLEKRQIFDGKLHGFRREGGGSSEENDEREEMHGGGSG